MDRELLELARSYAGADFDKPKIVERNVLSEWSGGEWTLGEFREILDDVPPEYAETAMVVFELGWRDDGASLKVTYQCPETAQEVAGRVERAFAYARQNVAEERARYKALRAKYGDS